MKKNINKILLFCATAFVGFSAFFSCSVEPTYYSEVVPETFYRSEENLWQRFNNIFTHWSFIVGQNYSLWMMEEFGTDEFCEATTMYGSFESYLNERWHHHEYDATTMTETHWVWHYLAEGISMCMDVMESFDEVDFDALKCTPGLYDYFNNQQRYMKAYYYLTMLNEWGGMPLYETSQDGELPRSSILETCEYVENLLLACLPELPAKEVLGGAEDNTIHQAACAGLLAQLYFNYEAYCGIARYDEAAKLCQDIIDGVYGVYELASDWTDIFGFTNEYCTENIWNLPSVYSYLQMYGWMWERSVPQYYYNYMGGNLQSSTGTRVPIGLVPSLDAYGNPYTEWRLGNPYEKFNDKDVRKKPYRYIGNGEYEGMFVIGELINPDDPSCVCTGYGEYVGEVLNVRDQVGYFYKLTDENDTWTIDEVNANSNISHGDESCMVRVVKRSPRPNGYDQTLMYNPDIPLIRLSEMYYTLAECKLRDGDAAGAAELINKVRIRYFEDGIDPDPVTADNLDMYRMLDEWMLEFLGEGRRRTDLRRWNLYVTSDWWDHKATNDPTRNLYPIHTEVLAAYNRLEQNPGY